MLTYWLHSIALKIWNAIMKTRKLLRKYMAYET